MKPEQRLFLSLVLTLGILLLWSVLLPPRQNPATEISQRIGDIEVKLKNEPKESIREISLGPFKFGIGMIRGGIQTLQVDGTNLLVAANPGLFQVEMIKPGPNPLQFESRLEGPTLLSVADVPDPEYRIIREVSLSKESDDLLTCKIRLINRSEHSQKLQLRLVGYQPLYSSDPNDQRFQSGMADMGGKTHSIRTKPGQRRDFPGTPSWITAQGKFYAVILKPSHSVGMFHVEHPASGALVGWLTLPESELAPNQEAQWEFKLYVGPLSLERLKKAGLEETISFGAFSGVARVLLGLLNWIHGWLKNYGLAIVFLGCLVWVVFFPFTWSGIRMTKVMAKLQPQIEKLKGEYGKDPQRMNREVLELYRKHRANPLSGCLPLIFQMPIFIALFQVLSRSPELRGANFLWIRDLSSPDALIRFPAAVPLLGNSLNLLPLLMMGAMFLQQRMTQSSQVAVTEEQRIQQKMFQWFPLFFGFLFYGLPSGLVLYWVTNTILTLGQYLLYFQLHQE